MTPDACRPVEVTVDGQRETIRVHGAGAPSEQAVSALGQLVEAVRARPIPPPTVRQAMLAVLKAHFPEGDRCRCGSASGTNATLWSAHVLNRLAELGLTRPLDETAVTT